MKKILLIVATVFFAISSYATVYNITTSGLTFSPNVVNAMVGDTIMFTISSNHPTQQVSEATWNAAGTTALSGGFGLHTSNFSIILTAGDQPTIWYVCTNHVGSGMKGIINVASAFIDSDGDGVEDSADNCPSMANADQADLDGDLIGDVCDDDIDGDGVDNADDAFPMDASETLDTDGDGTGNNADLDDDDDGCTDEEEIINGTDPLTAGDCTVSIHEMNTFGTIEMFPNATSDVVTIKTNTSITSLVIIDLSGKMVKEMTSLGNEVTINVSDLETGVYFIKLQNTQGNFSIERMTIK